MSSAARTRGWLAAALLLLVVAAYLCYVWDYRAYVNDDAYITFRYSLFLARGQGPYFNPGEHVEGYTNFLLMLVLAAVARLGGPDVVPATAKIIGVLGGLMALLASWALCARWLRRIPRLADYAQALAITAPALVAVNAAYALNTTSGLETTLFSGLIVLALWLQQLGLDAGRWRGAGVVFALAALTRPEGILVFAAALLGALVAGAWRGAGARRAALCDTAVVGVVVAAHFALRYACYDGELLPNTYYAKAGDAAWQTASAAEHLWGFARYHLGGLACGVALLALLARHADVRGACAPAFAASVCMAASLFKTGPDWMLGYRLLVPYVPIWAALSTCGLAAAVDWVKWRSLLATAVLCAALVWLVNRQDDVRRRYVELMAASAHGYRVGHMALADWLHERTAPGDTVALMDVGLAGYRCPHVRILDISGLTDRHIGQSPGAFLCKQYDPAYVLDQKPRFIVLVLTECQFPDGSRQYVTTTPAEGWLTRHALFEEHYGRARVDQSEGDPLAVLAGRVGAVRIFNHDDPKQTYLLVVFERKD